ncbi:hypothetical protein ID850_09480 [Xenorhabdus sp. Flor]|uniref:hypothetical protein n=1 Tax=Xenorhabdus cabanillasii TaxID=351673 RepID=UPI0019A59913|nr:hypothetical protein [Xenorhabdus sp. Flor]MBD2814992.1 hypothetical protein [Xenorhabdus sp. Flor]
MDFEENISDKFSVKEPDWKNYKLISYKNGRLFRLERGALGSSPIIFHNKEKNKNYNYNPYLSIINGKVVIAR